MPCQRSHVIQLIYATIEHPANWHGVLSALCVLTGSATARMVIEGTLNQTRVYHSSQSCHPDLAETGQKQSSPLHPDEAMTSGFCTMLPGYDISVSLQLHAPKTEKLISGHCPSQMECMETHFKQACLLSLEGLEVKLKKPGYENLLQYVRGAMVLLDTRGRVIHFNSVMEELVEQTQLLLVEPGQALRFSCQEQRRLYSEALSRSVQPGDKTVYQTTHYYIEHNEIHYKVSLHPDQTVKQSLLIHQSYGHHFLIIQPCATSKSIDPRDIMQLFPMTLAEADVCSKICSGYSTEDISKLRRTSLGTTRQQIKACLTKTHSYDKAGLASKVLRSLLLN